MWLLNPYRFGGWTPAQISTALWLDAADASTITLNGTTVSQWADKSGNNRHATQATASLQPTYTTTAINNRPALTFAPEGGSAQDRLNVSLTATTNNLTVFTVARKPSSSGNNKHRYSRVVTIHNTNDSVVLDYAGTSSWVPIMMPQQDSFGGVAAPSVLSFRNNNTIAVQAAAFNTAHIIGSTLSGSAVTLSLNGNAVTGSTSATTLNSNQLLIGASPAGIDGEMFGDIAEVIIASAQSTPEQQRIEGYLAHKWGLTANLPSDHPYKSVAP